MTNLRDHQLEGVEFIKRQPMCGLFFDMGLGKTLTTLKAIEELGVKTLIVAPLRVAQHVWPTEIEKWGFPFSVSFIHGRDKPKQLEAAVHNDITIVNPEGLKHVHSFCQGRYVPWHMMVVDESTMFKNCRSARWRYMAGLTQHASRVVLLTGTPISGRGWYDIWAQTALWGAANPYPPHSVFAQWFEWDIYGNPRRLLNPDWIPAMQWALEPHVLRKSIDEVDMPEYVELNHGVDVDKTEYEEVSLREHGYNPLRTVCSGFLYDMHWSGQQTARWHSMAKLEALEEIRQSGDNLLVFVNFTAEADAIRSQFNCPVVDGRTNDRDATAAITAWNQRRLPMLVMHPRSAGHGLNLQAGGHRVVWFSLPDSGELYQQANARLYRSGQQNSTVFVHRVIGERWWDDRDSIEEIIAELLDRKMLNESNLLNALEARLKSGQ